METVSRVVVCLSMRNPHTHEEPAHPGVAAPWWGGTSTFGFGVDGSHVVATLGKGLAHRRTGDGGVEQELHACPARLENRTLAARLLR